MEKEQLDRIEKKLNDLSEKLETVQLAVTTILILAVIVLISIIK